MEKRENIVQAKSYSFALRIIKLHEFMQNGATSKVLGSQILRSGTAIGALVAESVNAQSKADFVNKMNIALKEANETDYWLSLLKDSQIITHQQYESIHADCSELVALLVTIVKTSKSSI